MVNKKDFKFAYSPLRRKSRSYFKSPRKLSVKPSLPNAKDSTSAYIKVAIRVRPTSENELGANCKNVVKVANDRMLIFDPKEPEDPFFYQGVKQTTQNYLKRPNKDLQFVFDNVFGESASNKDIFNGSIKYLINSLMDGYHCSVFVYGATGAGKTFTMLGHDQCPGLTYLTMQELFTSIDEQREFKHFDICVSYLEIYNENVHDLLIMSGPLNLRDDGKFGVIVAGLTNKNINTAKELLDLLDQGNKNRTQHPTDSNAESSRSHAVFQVHIKIRTIVSGQVKIVKLSMIDLAGSERASATGCKGERFKEGANINRSLLALGNCINQLADGSKFIPYRDSKLTRLLKDSLGGNCRTVMIANVAPTNASYEDTYNTLKYAARAKKIHLKMKKNIVATDNHLLEYILRTEELTARIKQLEAELEKAKQTSCSYSLNTTATAIVNEQPSECLLKLKEKSLSHCDLLKTSMTTQIHQRKLAFRALHKHHTATLLSFLFCDTNHEQDSIIDTFAIRKSADLLISQAEEENKKIYKIWKEIQEDEEVCNELREQALNISSQALPVISILNYQKKMVVSELNEKFLKSIAMMQHEQINDLHSLAQNIAKTLKHYHLFIKKNGFQTSLMIKEYNDLLHQAKSSHTPTWEDESFNSDNQFFQYIITLDPMNLVSIPRLPVIEIPVNLQAAKIMKFMESKENHSTSLTDDIENQLNKTITLPSASTSFSLPQENVNSKIYLDPQKKSQCISQAIMNSTCLLSPLGNGNKLPKKPRGILKEKNLAAPLTGKVLPFIKSIPNKESKSGFGSSVNRFRVGDRPNTNNLQVGNKAVRGKEHNTSKSSALPYRRPPLQ